MNALKWVSGVMWVAMLLGGLAGSVQVALAAETPAASVPAVAAYQADDGERDARINARLAHRLRKQQLLLDGQANRLSMAREEVTFVQGRIDAESARGQDTTAIQAALDTFETQIEVAQGYWNTAQGILDAKAGFDASGNVADQEQARTTLQQAGDAQRECGHTLRNAAYEFRGAAREYRRGRLKP